MKFKFIFLSLLIILLCCEKQQNLIDSKNYRKLEDRIKTLKKYFKLKSEILDTEFIIYDVNINNRTIPGATDRDFKVGLKLNKEDIKYYLEDVNITSDLLDYQWIKTLIAYNKNFYVDDIPVIYKSPVKYVDEFKKVYLFEKENIIFIRIVQH